MTEKIKIQQIITDWKTQESETDKEIFLSKIKASVNSKNGKELLEGVKAIGEMVSDLQKELTECHSSTNRSFSE